MTLEPLAITPTPAAVALRCPFCREEVVAGAPARECARCETTLHAACAEENGRCTSLGCSGELGVRGDGLRRGFRLAPPPPSEARLWGAELAHVPLTVWATLGLLTTVAAAFMS